MSLTHDQLECMRVRKNAARSAIKFFKDIKPIRSANNPFDRLSKSKKDKFYENRNDYVDRVVTDKDGTQHYKTKFLTDKKGTAWREVDADSIVGSNIQAIETGMGNCDEKGRICFAALSGHPLLKRPPAKSEVTLVTAHKYDHVFVVISDIPFYGLTSLSTLGPTTMVVDGWTQDWYFPNISVFDAKFNALGNTPNPRQAKVRHSVSKHRFQPYGKLEQLPGVSGGWVKM